MLGFCNSPLYLPLEKYIFRPKKKQQQQQQQHYNLIVECWTQNF